MKNTFLPFFIIAMISISCSKNQKEVRQLEGDWKATKVEMTVLGQTSTQNYNETLIFTFEKCKVKNSFCDGQINDNGQITPFTYTIKDDGETIEILTGTSAFVMDIEKIDKETRKIDFDQADMVNDFMAFSGSLIPLEFQEDFNESFEEYNNEMDMFGGVFNTTISFILEKQ